MRAWALLLLVLTGCGAAVEAEVGTGSFEFDALPASGAVQIVCGPQGGQHIWTSVRARGIGPDNVTLKIGIVDPATNAKVCSEQFDGLLLDDAGDWQQFTGIRCFVADPTAIDGKTLRLQADLGDQAGHSAHAEHVLVPSGPGRNCAG